MNYPQPGWGPGQAPPPRGNTAVIVIAMIVVLAYAGAATTSLALGIVLSGLAGVALGVLVAAKLGAVRLPFEVNANRLLFGVTLFLASALFTVSGVSQREQDVTVRTSDSLPAATPAALAVPTDVVPTAIEPVVPQQPVTFTQLLQARRVAEAATAFASSPQNVRRALLANGPRCPEVTRRSGGSYSDEHDGDVVDWIVSITELDSATAMGGYMIRFTCGVEGLHLYTWAAAEAVSPVLRGRRRIIGRLTKNAFGVLEVRSALIVDPVTAEILAQGLP